MNFGLPFLSQIQGSDTAVAEELDLREGLTAKFGWIVSTFRSLVAGLTASYHIEHNPDDTHKTIHATGAISERGRTVPMGVWITVPFSAADYAAAGALVWTVTAANVGHLAYMLVGSTLLLDFQISGSALSGTADSTLYLQLPGGFRAARDHSAGLYYNNGSPATGRVRILAGDSQLRFTMATEGNWSLANPVALSGQIALEVNITGAIPASSNAYDIEYLIVAGGGGGGTNGLGSGVIYSGGGGAGGIKTGTTQVTSGLTCAVTIGAAGATGVNGGSTALTNFATVVGGGHGGAYGTAGAPGGSGGGGGGEVTVGGSGTSGQGFNGANGQAGNVPGAGGGGGSAAVSTTPGTGLVSTISGASITYAKGGPVQGNTQPTEPGSGGGGGLGDSGPSHAGVAGIVILRYLGAVRGTGGTITTAGAYTVHTFTTDGTFVA